MSQQKFAKYLNYTLQTILYLILITPLLVSPKFIFPFITSKTLFFRLLVEIAILLYVLLASLNKKYRPHFNYLSWAVIFFAVIVFITGITGVNFYKTFWGTVERGEGFLTLSHVFIYFLILTWTLKSKLEWFNYLSAAVISGIFVDLYAILQKTNQEHFFLFGDIINTGNTRISATIGNAAFMGAFTLAQFFLSLLLFFKRKNILWKIFFLLTGAVNFFILFQTQTRGALLAWTAVMIGLCFIYALKNPERTKRIIAAIILISVIGFATVIWFNRNADWVQKNNTLRRLVSISFNDVTTESRVLAWDTSWKSWQDRFIFGYGWENYNIAFNKYFHPEIFRDQGSQLWFDRAHNTPFDIAVATGIFGLLFYLSIFGIALYYLFKNIKKDFDLSWVLIGLLTSHFLQNIFVFDVLSTYILLFSTLGFVVFIKNYNNTSNVANSPNQPPNDSHKFNVIPVLIVLPLIIFMAYYFNIKPAEANMEGFQGLVYAVNGKESSAIIQFKKAIDMNTYQTPELRQKLADNILVYNKTKYNLNEDQIKNNYALAITEMQANIEHAPEDVQNYLYLMELYNRGGAYNPDYYQEVINLGDQALELSPTRPQTFFELGQAYANLGQFNKSISYFQQAVDLNPTTMESRWNLMTAYVLAGLNDKAEEQFQIMQELGNNLNNLESLNRLFNVYLVANNKQKILEVLLAIIELDPSGSNYARLAAIYKELGMYSQALAAVNKAVVLDPSLKSEADIFIQTINQTQ